VPGGALSRGWSGASAHNRSGGRLLLCTRGRDANLAAAFAAAGLNAFVFDYRNFAVSDGDNRLHPYTTHMTLYSDKSKVDAAAKIATRWFVETL
jgi:hypothetical protein